MAWLHTRQLPSGGTGGAMPGLVISAATGDGRVMPVIPHAKGVAFAMDWRAPYAYRLLTLLPLAAAGGGGYEWGGSDLTP